MRCRFSGGFRACGGHLFLRCQRVLLSSFLCFFLRIFLRRFLITELNRDHLFARFAPKTAPIIYQDGGPPTTGRKKDGHAPRSGRTIWRPELTRLPTYIPRRTGIRGVERACPGEIIKKERRPAAIRRLPGWRRASPTPSSWPPRRADNPRKRPRLPLEHRVLRGTFPGVAYPRPTE